ncbi:GNAT family acetyltransferase [Fulvivirga sp. 29W222]|uniref:GNAT family acetyltransferase n=1 Tax=Fulvivirga marina TaxID=2494733 RepID=A0A937KE12_9BACT|nr:GNAT family acetyltransferase [Fulvivirga marina]MBL6449222.1 GNAT family acetyltransferase [Fulvivirga marina]
MEVRSATLEDVQSVLDLQEKYLFNNLKEEDRKDGFVTTPFTQQQVERIISEGGLFIAFDKGAVVAYIFAGSWDYYAQWPIFTYMTSFFPKVQFPGYDLTTENSFQYGPICIDKAYRGGDLLKSLFEVMRLQMVERYPLTATFINKANARSLKAHTNKLGWSTVGEFQYNNQEYFIMAYDMNKSVLSTKIAGAQTES